MVAFEKILCPVDGSAFSARALGYAAQLADWYGGDVTAMHVHRPVPPTLWPEYPVMLREEADDGDDEQTITAFVRDYSDPAVPVVFRRGFVVPEILTMARELAADLVVIGTHGAGGLEHFLLGSVAENVLRHAPCPVLTVPRAVVHGPAGVRPQFRTIACAVDFSQDSRVALDFALSLAQKSEGRLLLVHALEHLATHQAQTNAHYSVPEARRSLISEARTQLEALLPPRARSWCATESIVGCGPAHREILRAAADGGADLIVLGVHGRSAVDLALFGSTTHRVLHQATCPVLTVPRDARLRSAAA